MKDERLLALIDLQATINSKYALFRKHDTLPERLDQLQNEIRKAEERLTSVEKDLKENQALIIRSNREIQQNQVKVTTLQSKLNQVKTTREYESRQKEIKVHKDRITELEKSISDAQQRDPEIQVAAKMVLSEVDTLKTRIQPEMDQITMELAQYEKELGAILAQEREKRAAVPTNILERIDKLTHMRGGLAIVPINDDCCGGCGVHLSPQTIQIAKRGLDLLQCDRCSSYIYWEDED